MVYCEYVVQVSLLECAFEWGSDKRNKQILAKRRPVDSGIQKIFARGIQSLGNFHEFEVQSTAQLTKNPYSRYWIPESTVWNPGVLSI